MLLDVAHFVRPALTVMDAVVGMDGDGPSAGRPFPIGAVLAGTDPVALDVAALCLVGQEPTLVPTVAGAVRRGWTTGRGADLNLLGDSLEALQVEGFRMPPGGGSSRLPGLLQRLGTQQLVASPYVSGGCTACGLCIESCPVQTITEVGGQAQIHLADCIRCYCCHELCPEQAIELRQPWLGRMVARLAQ
jgi:ferredoxin